MVNFNHIATETHSDSYLSLLVDFFKLHSEGEPVNVIYPFTNERLKAYEVFDYDKTLTTMTDHFFYAILSGSTDITLYDLNGMALMWLKLKLAFIATCEFDEFQELMKCIVHKNTTCNSTCNNCEFYSQICQRTLNYLKSHVTDDEYRIICLLLNAIKDDDERKRIFSSYTNIEESIFNDYESYNKIKSRITSNSDYINVSSIHCDIEDLPSYLEASELGKFTTILTSNISDYKDDLSFFECIMDLCEFLDDAGQIQVEYVFTPLHPAYFQKYEMAANERGFELMDNGVHSNGVRQYILFLKKSPRTLK